jgi:hypothetical protein
MSDNLCTKCKKHPRFPGVKGTGKLCYACFLEALGDLIMECEAAEFGDCTKPAFIPDDVGEPLSSCNQCNIDYQQSLRDANE